MTDMTIGVIGAAGRMGRMLLSAIAEAEGCRIGGGTESAGNAALGLDLGALVGLPEIGVAVTDDAAALARDCEAIIEFTTPEATARHAALAAEAGCIHVIGTTGLAGAEQAAVEEAAKKTAIVQAPNMSLGVNLLFALVEQVARALDEDYDIEILEMHHRHKVDAPSGTALGLGRAAASGRGVDLDAVAQKVRDGRPGARPRGEIGFATLRGGDVIGDHSVIFAAEGERVELTHKASSRVIYSRGAVKACKWARGKRPGLYSMKDVLGLS